MHHLGRSLSNPPPPHPTVVGRVTRPGVFSLSCQVEVRPWPRLGPVKAGKTKFTDSWSNAALYKPLQINQRSYWVKPGKTKTATFPNDRATITTRSN